MVAWARTGEITVVLPPKQGRRLSVSTTQQMGLLLVDADLDRLVARADDGAVILRGAARTVEVHDRDGSVHTREPISVRESFTVNSIDGDVSVDFRDVPPRRISVVTADGDINIGLPGDGPFAVQTSTGSQGRRHRGQGAPGQRRRECAGRGFGADGRRRRHGRGC